MRHTESKGNGIHPTAIEQLDFTRSDLVTTAFHDTCEPILAIVVQGQKKALLGEEMYKYDAGQYLIISVDLPLSSFVVEATSDKPYLGLKLNLDSIKMRSVLSIPIDSSFLRLWVRQMVALGLLRVMRHR
jgi:hypothetical protein